MKHLLLALLLLAAQSPIYAHSHYRPQSILYAQNVPASYRAAFCEEVRAVSKRLDIKPDWLMISMCFETGGTFRANIINRASGASGLIQFIPTTARRLGTTTAEIRRMTALDQLSVVERYFKPYIGRMHDPYDVYIVVFAPAFLGRPDDQVLYRANGRTALDRRRYRLNRVLDTNRDGLITIRDVKSQIGRLVPSTT